MTANTQHERKINYKYTITHKVNIAVTELSKRKHNKSILAIPNTGAQVIIMMLPKCRIN